MANIGTRKVVQATLDPDLANEFKNAASSAGISEADLVRQAIRAYLGKECMKPCPA